MLTRKSLVVLATVGVVGLGAGAVLAGSSAISGSFEATYSKRDVLPVGDQDGHILMLAEVNGTNTDASGTGFQNGSSVSVKEISDLVRGSGPSEGYCTITDGRDGTVVAIKGQITTTMKSDGTPKTTFKGKWRYVQGTGKYEGIQGEGSYEGYFVAQDRYHVDWKGSKSMRSDSVSER